MKRFLVIGMILLMSLGLFAERKALVISNSAYDGMTLSSPANDALDMANALGAWGFSVRARQNLNLRQMTALIDSLEMSIGPEDEIVFYYSGHGTNENGINYLVPAGVNMQTRQVFARSSYSLRTLIEKLGKARSAVIILEAGHNWLPSRPRSTTFFEYMSVPDCSVSVMMSVKPFRTIGELNPERSTFTQAFIQKFNQSQLDYNETVKAWQRELRASSERNVDFWYSGPIRQEMYFNNISQRWRFKTNLFDVEGGGSLSW